jgi:hypothetical protein
MAGTPSTGYATNTFSIDNSARYQVIAQTYCRRIVVQENYNSANTPTCDLLMAAPAGATQVAIAKGTPAIFTPPTGSLLFTPGQLVGDIETASGSCTVQQVESQQV